MRNGAKQLKTGRNSRKLGSAWTETRKRLTGTKTCNVPTGNACGTVRNSRKQGCAWTETPIRLPGNVQEVLPWQKNWSFSATTAVYLSFTAEGQGSWERVSFPGIVGGGCVPGPRPGEMPAGGGGDVFANFQAETQYRRLGFGRMECPAYGSLGRITENCPRSENGKLYEGAENCTEGAENLRNERKTVQNGRKTVQNGRKTGSVTRIRVAATVSCCLGRMTFSGPVRVDN